MAYNHVENFKGAIGNRGKPAKNQGRKPKIIRPWIKECNLTRSDAQAILKNLLMLTFNELQAMQKDTDKLASISSILLSTAIKSHNRGDPKEVHEIFDLAFGKETQKVELATIPPEARAALEAVFSVDPEPTPEPDPPESAA
jgi:hypothetical protein